MRSANCSGYPDNCGELQPNQDIAGIGVYITFIASAMLTLIGAILKFICRARMQKEIGEHHPAFLGHLQRLRPEMTRRQGRRWDIGASGTNIMSLLTAQTLDAMLGPLILGLADQQLVTGLAILIAALTEWQTISGYHYNIVVYLAWFSSFTHAVALFSLGDLLKKSKVLLGLRMTAFSTVFTLFVVAQSRARTFGITLGTVVEREISDGSAGACPAQCAAIARGYDGGAFELRISVIAIAVFGICLTWGDGKWFTLAGSICNGRYLDGILKAMLVLWLMVVSALALGLAFGIAAAVSLRNPSTYPGLQVAANFGEQNSWSFGQLVAVILLILPLLGAFQSFLDAQADSRSDGTSELKNRDVESCPDAALSPTSSAKSV